MVVASPSPTQSDCVQPTNIPVIDISQNRTKVAEEIVKVCEEFGIFHVISHGVDHSVVTNLEAKGLEFFALPMEEKQRSGPPTPLGYGSRSIGCKGDTGELEYLLLHTNPMLVSQRAQIICSKDPWGFSCVVNGYVEAVRGVACEILELLAVGLKLEDTGVLSRIIKDEDSDSWLRLNYYPSCFNNNDVNNITGSSDPNSINKDCCRIGFGEHSDPQVLTLLRSTDEGLQILPPSAEGWVPVSPVPAAFTVFVGDTLQALTNGRLLSVKHRVVASSRSSRFSMMFFGAPPPHLRISPLPEMVTKDRSRRYRPFTWTDYMKIMYSLRLSYNRLELYRTADEEEDGQDNINSSNSW